MKYTSYTELSECEGSLGSCILTWCTHRARVVLCVAANVMTRNDFLGILLLDISSRCKV